MYKSILFLGICSTFALGSKLPVHDEKFEKIVSCYYQPGDDLSVDPKDGLRIDNIDVSLCTHIMFFFIELNADASLNTTTGDINDKHDNTIKRFNDLRKKKPHLKTLVTLQATENYHYSANHNDVVTNPILRQKVVNNVVELVKKCEFNGLDIIWEYSTRTSGNQEKAPSDKQNFVLLLKALREKFDKEGLILSVTVSAVEEAAKISYNIKEISKYVDFINLQTYDFYLKSEPGMRVTHPTAVYPSSKGNAEERKLNIDYVVKYWISQGAPPRKLIVGTSSTGTGFTLANPKKVARGALFFGSGAPLGAPEALASGETNDGLDDIPKYYEICRLLKNPKWRHLYDKEEQVPYIYKWDLIVAYDDVESIKKKAEYVKKMNLGGVFMRTIDQDDFNGNCGEKFPLLKALNRVFGYKC